jgi:hypothetical protein
MVPVERKNTTVSTHPYIPLCIESLIVMFFALIAAAAAAALNLSPKWTVIKKLCL